jgi:hypothetical protein
MTSINVPIPPRIPGSSVYDTIQAETAKFDNMVGPIISKLNTWKGSVKVATTAAITLSGLQTVDGIVLLENDLVLVKNQGGGITNGIYVASAGTWLRAQNLVAGSSAAGIAIFVNQGTANGDKAYVCTNVSGTDVVGVNNLVFVLLASTTGGPAAGTNGQIQYNNNGVLGGDISTTDGAGHLTVVSLTASTGSVTAVGHVYSSKANYTQITNATTPVPITTNAGNVTTFSLTNATTVSTVFTLTGSVVLSTSQVMLTNVAYSGVPLTNGIPLVYATSVTTGVATITVSNYGVNALAGTVSFNYIIV